MSKLTLCPTTSATAEATGFLQPDGSWSQRPDALLIVSESVHDALHQPSPAHHRLQAVAAIPGEVIARLYHGIKSDDEPRPGLHVERVDDEYRAQRYGYVCLRGGVLSILSPFHVSADARQVLWFTWGTRSLDLTRQMVDTWLQELGIRNGIEHEVIDSIIEQLRPGPSTRPAWCIARALEGPPGLSWTIRVGGAVQEGQSIAAWDSSGRDKPGLDVFGQRLRNTAVHDMCGTNVRVAERNGTSDLIATCSGLVTMVEGRVGVYEVLELSEAATQGAGQMNFDTSVHVRGSIEQGFQLSAEGDVRICGRVDTGGTVEASGNICVEGEISGAGTRVRAGGNVTTHAVYRARVDAGGDIQVITGAENAELHCGGDVVIPDEEGDSTHGIRGGRIWARGRIQAPVLGTESGVATSLVVGVDAEQTLFLERLERVQGTCHEHIVRIMRRINLTGIDVNQIRVLINATTGPRRKILVNNTRQLARLGKIYRDQLSRRQDLLANLNVTMDYCEVRARLVHRGVRIRIGGHCHRVDETLHDVRFHANDQGMQIR